MPYPELPRPPARGTDEPALLYGQRLVLWLLGDGIPGVLSDDALELAGYAAANASATPGYSTPVYDTLSRMRHTIAATLAVRAGLGDAPAVMMAGGTAPHRPNVGPMAPLQPAPAPMPPAPAYAAVGAPQGARGARGPVDRAYDDIAF